MNDAVRLVPADWTIVAAKAEEHARVAAEAKKKAGEAAKAKEKAIVAAEAKEKGGSSGTFRAPTTWAEVVEWKKSGRVWR